MTYKTILDYLTNRRQLRPLPGQVPNAAGGHYFAIDKWARLERFLMLGSESGTYYVGAVQLTRENATAVAACLDEDGARTVRRIVDVSVSGRAPKNEPALFALAMAASDGSVDTRRLALAALPKVARTGTHVLHFADYVQAFRGWGRGLRRAVGGWFNGMPVERLALQAVKYPQRDGWALRDLLRLAHPMADSLERRALFDWIAHPDEPAAVASAREAFPLIDGVARVRAADSAAEVARIVTARKLPREAVPTEWLRDAGVWEALLADMPMGAMIRTLGRMASVGLLVPGSEVAAHVVARLENTDTLKAARIHPIQLLLALRTYAQGRGALGRLTWVSAPEIVDALDAAFDRAFDFVEGSGKRLLVAVDVSGSMGWPVAGSPVLRAYEAAGAVALTMLRTETAAQVIAFDTRVHQPSLSRRQRLDDVTKSLSRWGGGTDLSLPFLYALDRRLEVDGFVIATDHETWAGRVHAAEALDRYRAEVNPSAKVALLATAANGGQVIDPADPLAFGAAGFDAAVPRLVTGFMAD